MISGTAGEIPGTREGDTATFPFPPAQIWSIHPSVY